MLETWDLLRTLRQKVLEVGNFLIKQRELFSAVQSTTQCCSLLNRSRIIPTPSQNLEKRDEKERNVGVHGPPAFQVGDQANYGTM